MLFTAPGKTSQTPTVQPYRRSLARAVFSIANINSAAAQRGPYDPA